MKKDIAILLLSLLIIQLLTSCQKSCQSVLLASFRFSQEDLDIVPYEGHDTLVFVSSAGHTITFKAYGRIAHFGQQGYEYVEFPRSDDYCPGNYYYTEENRMEFYGSVSGSWLNFYQQMSNPFAPPVIKYLGISMTVRDSIYWSFSSSYRFDSLKLYEDKPPYPIIPVHDNVLIGSQVYHQVYVLPSRYTSHVPTGNLDTLYYSLTEGVLGFRNEYGVIWQLK